MARVYKNCSITQLSVCGATNCLISINESYRKYCITVTLVRQTIDHVPKMWRIHYYPIRIYFYLHFAWKALEQLWRHKTN